MCVAKESKNSAIVKGQIEYIVMGTIRVSKRANDDYYTLQDYTIVLITTVSSHVQFRNTTVS